VRSGEYRGVVLLAAGVILAASCRSSSATHVSPPHPPRDFTPLLRYLDARQRQLFDVLEDDPGRERFLVENGVTFRWRVDSSLQKGMAKSEVAAQLGGEPLEHETQWSPTAADEFWTYRERLTANQRFKVVLHFRDDRLIGWDVQREEP
jgi:hypothetical protein